MSEENIIIQEGIPIGFFGNNIGAAQYALKEFVENGYITKRGGIDVELAKEIN